MIVYFAILNRDDRSENLWRSGFSHVQAIQSAFEAIDQTARKVYRRARNVRKCALLHCSHVILSSDQGSRCIQDVDRFDAVAG